MKAVGACSWHLTSSLIIKDMHIGYCWHTVLTHVYARTCRTHDHRARRFCTSLSSSPWMTIHIVFEQKELLTALELKRRKLYSQQLWSCLMAFLAFQTAELHLKPPPNPNCQILSPFFTPAEDSMQPRMYHVEAADVLPNLHSIDDLELTMNAEASWLSWAHDVVSYVGRTYAERLRE